MPTSAAETPAAIDAFAGREAPETELSLAQVARRLNRLAAQRALYRCLAAALLGASALAAAAALLSAAEFRIALGGLGLVVVVVVALSLRALRRRWADALAAARWVEHKIPLEQRLLTLVSAPQANVATRIWPELVADNRAQLQRWSGARLGIPVVPANLLLLLGALVTAWLFLVPWYGADGGPLDIPGRPAASGNDSAPGADGGAAAGVAGPGPQAGFQDGTTGAGGDAAGEQQTLSGPAAAAIGQLQDELAQRFESSLAGSTMLDGGSGKTGDGAEPQAKRGEVAESGLGKSNAEQGGVVPDEQLARREQDDGTGQTVQHENGGAGGAAKARPGAGERGRPADANAQKQAKGGPQAGGRPVAGGDKPADGPLALGNEDGKKTQAGGAGAGSGKATEALLAKKPLTLDGGRQTARFSLTLGGSPGKGGDGPKSMEAQPTSRIADAASGPQEADRAVRHEEIPADYEAVVKRIFKRDP